MRRPLSVLVVALVSVVCASCGSRAPTTGSTTSVDESLSVEDNQQGHVEIATTLSYPMTTSPLPNTYVWCEDSAGSACLRATAALGAMTVKDPENATPALFDLEDLPDDCSAPGMAELRRRLDASLGFDPIDWRDQGGNRLDASLWPNVYSAAGCISNAGSPVAKIAASSSASPRLYLVRVWESG